MLGCVWLVSGTSSHHLHSIFITQTQTVTSWTEPSPHAGPPREEKMAAGGGVAGHDAPSYQAPDACIIPWGRSLVGPAPCRSKGWGGGGGGGGAGLVGTVDRDAIWPSRAPGLALPRRGRASETRSRKKRCPPERTLQQAGGQGHCGETGRGGGGHRNRTSDQDAQKGAVKEGHRPT